MDTDRSCNQPEASLVLTSYCFGDAPSEDRVAFERHLTSCAFCRDEVERLSAAVRTLRTDKDIQSAVSEADLASLVGISARADLPFFGHAQHVMISSALLAVNYVLILFIEIAYGFDIYGRSALKVAPLLFSAVFLLSIATLAFDERLIRQGHTSSVWANLIMTSSAALVYTGVCFYLPDHPIIQVKVTAYSAQVSYLKDVLYILPVSILFITRPFHFICLMQLQLSNGRHRAALSLLTKNDRALAPRGVSFPSVRVLIAVIVIAFLYLIPASLKLFDILLPGPYTSLFSKLILVRWICYFAMLTECLLWYRHSIEELKRECMVMTQAER